MQRECLSFADEKARTFSARRIEVAIFDPDAAMPRPNRSLIYFGGCIIAGLRPAQEKQVNVRVIPIGNAIEESVDLAHEIFNRVYMKVPGVLAKGETSL